MLWSTSLKLQRMTSMPSSRERCPETLMESRAFLNLLSAHTQQRLKSSWLKILWKWYLQSQVFHHLHLLHRLLHNYHNHKKINNKVQQYHHHHNHLHQYHHHNHHHNNSNSNSNNHLLFYHHHPILLLL